MVVARMAAARVAVSRVAVARGTVRAAAARLMVRARQMLPLRARSGSSTRVSERFARLVPRRAARHHATRHAADGELRRKPGAVMVGHTARTARPTCRSSPKPRHHPPPLTPTCAAPSLPPSHPDHLPTCRSRSAAAVYPNLSADGRRRLHNPLPFGGINGGINGGVNGGISGGINGRAHPIRRVLRRAVARRIRGAYSGSRGGGVRL